VFAKVDFRVALVAVLDNIPQRLLQDPEYAQRSIRRDICRQVRVSELNLNLLLYRVLVAKTPDCCEEAYVLKFRRVKAVRKCLHVA